MEVINARRKIKISRKVWKSNQISKEELDKIKNIQNSYIGAQQAFGQLKVNKIRLEQQMDALEKAGKDLRTKFTEIQTSEQDLIKELSEKYGDGTLNIDSGTFTPNKSE